MKREGLRKRVLGWMTFGILWILVLGCSAFAAGTPGKVKKLKGTAGENKVTLTWAETKNADGYLVYAVNQKASKKTVIRTVKGKSKTKTLIRKLKNGKNYDFCVAAYSGTGKKRRVGAASAIIRVKPKIIMPGQTTPHLLDVSEKSVTFDFNQADNATSYNYWLRTISPRKTIFIGSLKKVKKITLNKLKAGTKYRLTMTTSRIVDGEKVSSKQTNVYFTAEKDYLRSAMLNSIVQYSDYTSSDTSIVYNKTQAEAFANFGNGGTRFNSGTNYLIWTNLYTRRFFLFTRDNTASPWRLKWSTPCIIGRPSAATPRTVWMIRDKRDPAEGARYACYLELYTYAIHSLIIGQADWSSLTNGYMASAGCIRIMVNYAEYVYQNCGVGTTVVTR